MRTAKVIYPTTTRILARLPLLLGLILATVPLLGVMSTGYLSKSMALSGSSFQAGNIVDDGVFFNSFTMSSLDVQHFLNAKVPACDTNGSKMYDATRTRATYGSSQGHPAPYTCLKDYRQDTPTMPAEASLCNAFNGGNRSAAQIILDSAAACGINPQVLLVLLQKEQSLVTDEWPWPTQYTKATGFGCPDTAPCDNTYAGFFYQVYYAARQFKKYATSANSFNYFARSNNTIGYHPSSSCGSSSVYLSNQATTNLYIYTPYQPNQAALNNLYGSGDSCSSYGNRNFWRMFNDWFGSTHAPAYGWMPTSQEAYGDAARTKPINTKLLAANTTYYMRLRAQNLGNSTWHNSGGAANNQINLGTTNAKNRNSIFAASSWLAPSRPTTLKESTVLPGEYGTFEFALRTSAANVSSSEYFGLVVDGKQWLNDVGMHWAVHVRPPTAQWSLESQKSYYDPARTKTLNSKLLAPNTAYYTTIKVRNTGNTVWSNSGANPVRLGTNGPQDRISKFYDSSWPATNRAATLSESSVAPGDVGTFNFIIRSPSEYSTFKEGFRPVREGASWLNDVGLYYPLTVAPPTYDWSFQNQAAYTDNTKSATRNLSALMNATRFYTTIKVRNTGNTVWSNSGANPVRLGTNGPQDRISKFYDSSWPATNRAATLSESSVAPGDVGTFNFWLTAPYSINGTKFKEGFRPVAEGNSWMRDIGLHVPATMESGSSLPWTVTSQAVYTNNTYSTTVDTTQLDTNTVYYVQLKLRNLSGRAWSNTNFRLGTSNPMNRTSAFAHNWLSSNRPAKLVESQVNPGDVGTIAFTIRTPSSGFNSAEYFRPVLEGVEWLPDIGLYLQLTSS